MIDAPLSNILEQITASAKMRRFRVFLADFSVRETRREAGIAVAEKTSP